MTAKALSLARQSLLVVVLSYRSSALSVLLSRQENIDTACQTISQRFKTEDFGELGNFKKINEMPKLRGNWPAGQKTKLWAVVFENFRKYISKKSLHITGKVLFLVFGYFH